MSQNTQEQQSLMLGARINWPYILGTGVIKFQNSIVKIEGQQSEQETREAALALFYSIPEAWIKSDEEFKAELKKAVEKQKVDVRKEWCGHKVGPPKFKTEKTLNPHKLYHACVNVFQRRGLLSKTIYLEKMVPEPEDFEKK